MFKMTKTFRSKISSYLNSELFLKGVKRINVVNNYLCKISYIKYGNTHCVHIRVHILYCPNIKNSEHF